MFRLISGRSAVTISKLGNNVPTSLSLALLAVLEPLPRYLAHAVALVFRRDLPCLIEIGRRQQAVGEQEVGEMAGMTALLPDEALQQLLVVGDRSLPAQVQGDDHIDHRHRLRGGQAEDE